MRFPSLLFCYDSTNNQSSYFHTSKRCNITIPFTLINPKPKLLFFLSIAKAKTPANVEYASSKPHFLSALERTYTHVYKSLPVQQHSSSYLLLLVLLLIKDAYNYASFSCSPFVWHFRCILYTYTHTHAF